MSPQLKTAVVVHRDDAILLERRRDQGTSETWGLPEYTIEADTPIPVATQHLLKQLGSLEYIDEPVPFSISRTPAPITTFTFGVALRVHAREYEGRGAESIIESDWVRLSDLSPDLPSPVSSTIAAFRRSVRSFEAPNADYPAGNSSQLILSGFSKKSLRVEYDHRVAPHPHAETHFGPIEEMDYLKALRDLYLAKDTGAAEVTFHIPDEIQLASCRNESRGNHFIDFVCEAASTLGLRVVWENAPRLTPPDWSLVEQSTYVPARGDLCLDIGHKMLGARDKESALKSIDRFMEQHGSRVRHLHLHINDFKCDQHVNDPATVIEFLGLERFKRMTEHATYIFEKGF